MTTKECRENKVVKRIRSRAPLRIGLAGGGTDVSPYSELYGGIVINATIDLYAHGLLEESKNGLNSFINLDKDIKLETKQTPRIKYDERFPLHVAVYNYVVENFNNGESLAVNIYTYADAPPGSGLGTSSTMVVCLLNLFLTYLEIKIDKYQIANIAYHIERIILGMHGGKQDQYAAVFGGFNCMKFNMNGETIVHPLSLNDEIINELETGTILFYTGKSRLSSNIIQEQIKNTIDKNAISIEAMHTLKEEAEFMIVALRSGDFSKYNQIMNRSWNAKKKLSKSITNDFLEKIYNGAIENGATSGKISGAGGGGFFIFYCDITKKVKLKEYLKNYGEIINFHFTDKGSESWLALN